MHRVSIYLHDGVWRNNTKLVDCFMRCAICISHAMLVASVQAQPLAPGQLRPSTHVPPWREAPDTYHNSDIVIPNSTHTHSANIVAHTHIHQFTNYLFAHSEPPGTSRYKLRQIQLALDLRKGWASRVVACALFKRVVAGPSNINTFTDIP